MPDKPSAVAKALELLARRSHFRRELATKLRRRGYPEEEIESALARVAGYGYLDDHATARQWVETRLARGPEGRRRLASELTRHGADSGVVEAVLSEMLPDDDRPAAREAAERWLERRSAPPRPDALARHLERKGFSEGAIWELLDELRERFA